MLPYFTPTILAALQMAGFLITGNVIAGAWLIYVGTPLYNLVVLDDHRNIERKNEKAFMQSTMFLIPLWTIVVFNVLTNIYFLAMFSTKYEYDLPFSPNRDLTDLQYVLLTLSFSFFGALTQLSGHELVHQKDAFNKFMGAVPYAQFFYTHFGDEHCIHHHKFVATDHDSVSHPRGRNVYSAILNGFIGTQTSTWRRE